MGRTVLGSSIVVEGSGLTVHECEEAKQCSLNVLCLSQLMDALRRFLLIFVVISTSECSGSVYIVMKNSALVELFMQLYQ